MFNIIKKFAIAMLACCSGPLYASGDNNNNDVYSEHGRQPVVASAASPCETDKKVLTKDIWKQIFVYASQETKPLELALICKTSYHYMFDREFVKLKYENISLIPVTPYSDLKPFMQTCLNRWLGNEDCRRFNNGILRFESQGNEVVDLRFADLDKTNGIFALPAHFGAHVRIMKNVQEFLKTGGDNAANILILAVLYSEAEKVARSMQEEDHPFVMFVREWDISVTNAGYLFRFGNDDVTKWGFLYVTGVNFAVVSSMTSILELLRKGCVGGPRQAGEAMVQRGLDDIEVKWFGAAMSHARFIFESK